jgi:hypothetical protein
MPISCVFDAVEPASAHFDLFEALGINDLYRGELAIRYQRVVYGISWTPELAVARMFADRRQHLGEGEGDGVVLQIDATPSMIVTGPGEHTGYLGETEYVMDPRMIGDAIRVPI